MSFLADTLAQVDVEIETAVSSPRRFNLGALAAGGEPGFWTKALRPRVRIYVGGELVKESEPAGDPTGVRPAIYAGAIGLTALVAVLAIRGMLK